MFSVKSIPFLFGLLIIISCTSNSSENTQVFSSEAISDSISVRDTSRAEKLAKLPALAQYINELKRYEGEDVNNGKLVEPSTILELKDDVVIYPQQEDDYSWYHKLEHFDYQTASFKGGWEGTSGIYAWSSAYSLLSDDPQAPIVAVAFQSKMAYRGFQEYMEEQQELIEDLITKGIEGDIEKIAASMQERDWLGNAKGLDGEVDNHYMGIIIWQKKSGAWEDVTTAYMHKQIIYQLEEHFPFLSNKEQETGQEYGYVLEEKLYSDYKHAANKIHYENWFGATDASINMDLEVDGNDIVLQLTKDREIRWKWKEKAYQLINLPQKVALITTVCKEIDWTTKGTYTFKGKIGKHPITMEAILTPTADNILLEGTYWYTNQKASKFEIKGQFHNDNDQQVTFYRMKKGVEREQFDCYFFNCRLEGWWQHLETMEIEQFSLELAE